MTFPALSAHLGRVPIAAPFYIIVGGPGGEGLVIARNETGSVGTDALGADEPFLVQTNYDRWLPDPKLDPRRSYAEGLLRSFLAAGKGAKVAPTLSQLDLFAVAGSYPGETSESRTCAAATAALRSSSDPLHPPSPSRAPACVRQQSTTHTRRTRPCSTRLVVACPRT
jgi:hypothetical protein